jgi:hypothetical protein
MVRVSLAVFLLLGKFQHNLPARCTEYEYVIFLDRQVHRGRRPFTPGSARDLL